MALSDFGYGTSYLHSTVGILEFSGSINWNGKYDKKKLQRNPAPSSRDYFETTFNFKVGGYLNLLMRQLNAYREDLDEFVGISRVEQVAMVLKQAVIAYWSNRLDALQPR